MTDAAGWFDRAVHDRHQAAARRVSQARHLRTTARWITVTGAVSRDRDTTAALHLVFTLAALAESLADLRHAQDRLSQARAARRSARQLHQYRPPAGTARAPDVQAARAPMPDPSERRGRRR